MKEINHSKTQNRNILLERAGSGMQMTINIDQIHLYKRLSNSSFSTYADNQL